MNLPPGTPGSRRYFTLMITEREQASFQRVVAGKIVTGDTALIREVCQRIADLHLRPEIQITPFEEK